MTTPTDYSPRVHQFLTELEALCVRYDLRLERAGYDPMLIFRRAPYDAKPFEWEDFCDSTHNVAEEP